MHACCIYFMHISIVHITVLFHYLINDLYLVIIFNLFWTFSNFCMICLHKPPPTAQPNHQNALSIDSTLIICKTRRDFSLSYIQTRFSQHPCRRCRHFIRRRMAMLWVKHRQTDCCRWPKIIQVRRVPIAVWPVVTAWRCRWRKRRALCHETDIHDWWVFSLKYGTVPLKVCRALLRNHQDV